MAGGSERTGGVRENKQNRLIDQVEAKKKRPLPALVKADVNQALSLTVLPALSSSNQPPTRHSIQ